MVDQGTFSAERFGKYVLLERIGRGGMAEVFRSKIVGPGGFEKEFAVKKILPQLLDDEQFVTMFIDEARLTAQLVHPNIVQVHELDAIDGQLYIAMEFVAGKDLLDLLARCARRGRRFPLEVVLHVTNGILKGLAFAHAATDDQGASLGIVHRDVSPSNILLSYVGHTKVSDFGIAKSHIQSQMTLVGTQKGKVGYMSPEQVAANEVTPRSDLFAAGVILFEMLTMTRLFKHESDLEVLLKIRDCNIEEDLLRMADVPLGLQAVVRRALQKDPEKRYQTAEAFHAALAEFALRSGLMPDDAAVAEFLREMFADKITEERRRRALDPTLIAELATQTRVESTWRYRDSDGQIHGPMRAGMMRELLASRTETPGEAASCEGGDWRHIHSFETLREVVRAQRPAPPVAAPQPPPVRDPEMFETPRTALDAVGGFFDTDQLDAAAQIVAEDYASRPSIREQLGTRDWEQISLASMNPNRVRRRRRGEIEQPTSNDPLRRPDSDVSASTLATVETPVQGVPRQPAPARAPTGEHENVVLPILEVGPGAAPDRSHYGDPALEGDLRLVSPARLLFRLARSRATGLFAMTSPDENKAIFVRDGAPVLIETSNRDELLGSLLVARGICSDARVTEALHYARRNGIRIGEALVRLGHLPPQQLFHALTEQLTEKLTTGILTTEGQWQWWPGAVPNTEPPPVRVEVGAVIAQAVNERMKSAALRQHFELRRRLVLRTVADRGGLDGLPISTRALRLLSTLREGDTVSEVVRRFVDGYRWKEADVYRLLYLLTELEVLRYAGEPAQALP